MRRVISLSRIARLESAAAARANVAGRGPDDGRALTRRILDDPVALRMALDLANIADHRPDGMAYLTSDPEAAARMRAIMEQVKRSEAARAA